MFDDIAGTQDVSRGVADGVTAARAIESLQEAANTRVRQKSRILDKTLGDFGRLWLSRTFQYRSAPYVYRVTGQDGVEQFFKFHADGENAVLQPMGMGPDGNQIIGDTEVIPLTQNFDVRVTTGSSLSIAKRDSFNKSMTLYNAQVLSKRSLLEAAEVKNVDQELQRLAEEQQASAMAQMQAQGGMVQPEQNPLQPGA